VDRCARSAPASLLVQCLLIDNTHLVVTGSSNEGGGARGGGGLPHLVGNSPAVGVHFDGFEEIAGEGTPHQSYPLPTPPRAPPRRAKFWAEGPHPLKFARTLAGAIQVQVLVFNPYPVESH
jgi:hypothetical protein